MAKFINPFTDIGFKRIFGQEISKPLIIDFLNSLLLGEERITNITTSPLRRRPFAYIRHILPNGKRRKHHRGNAKQVTALFQEPEHLLCM